MVHCRLTWVTGTAVTSTPPTLSLLVTVEVLFEGYAYNVDGNGFVLFQCGDFAGTTIVKNVKVIDLDATAIKSVKKADKADGATYNLAGQKVNASYKGVVIKNGKKFIQK